MGEEVLAAVIRRDEPEALGVVEPLHGACRHVLIPILKVRDSAEAALPGEIFKGIRLPQQAPLGGGEEGTADSCLKSYAVNVTQ
jgi:hypothetical protein